MSKEAAAKRGEIEVFESLEAQIEKEFEQKVETCKGCFGTLLFSADEDECKSCEFFVPCEEKHAANRISDMETMENQIEAEILDKELSTEVAEMALHEDAKARGLFIVGGANDQSVDISKLEVEEIGTESAVEDIEVPDDIKVEDIKIPEVEIDDIEEALKRELAEMTETGEPEAKVEIVEEKRIPTTVPAAPATPVVATPAAPATSSTPKVKKLLAAKADWIVIIGDITKTKPPTMNDVLTLVVTHLVKQGVDEKDLRKNYQELTRRAMAQLGTCGLLDWNESSSTFTWK